jgi:hypothetical protein
VRTVVFCMRSHEVEKDPWLTCIEEQDELVREPGHAGDGHLQSEHQQPNEPDKKIFSIDSLAGPCKLEERKIRQLLMSPSSYDFWEWNFG